jgi:uncharacterized protein (TIGR02391 family)
MSKRFSHIEPNILEGICKILGDSLSNSEIDKYLLDANLSNVSPVGTKWKRLYNSFIEYQYRNQISNSILKFIQITLHPSRYLNRKEEFERYRSDLNKLVSFIELELGDDSVFRSVVKSQTISDAEKRATSLLSKLKDRNVHEDVLKFCKAELLVDNYFHAVFEATKSVADKIRELSGDTHDGSELVDAVFSIRNPILIINRLVTETEKSEHKGFANLLKGFFGMFRNTTAHAPRISWEIGEQDALDILSLASLCHRKLDNSTKIR